MNDDKLLHLRGTGLSVFGLTPASLAGAPATGAFALGELWCDSDGVIWRCTASGSPGTWEEFGSGTAADVLVSVSGDDTTAGYLVDKIVAGEGIGLGIFNAGADEQLIIQAADEQVLVSLDDTSNGYLATKLAEGDGITLTILNPGADEQLEISVPGLADKADTAGTVMDGDAAGGVLAGTYPNPSFASDMATQAELDAHITDTSDAHPLDAVKVSKIYAADGSPAALSADNDGNLIADQGFAVARVRATSSAEASLASTTHGLQIGADNADNLILDTDEVQARNNGSAADLHLNPHGGDVIAGATIEATQLISNIATGTAPLVVTSTTKVTNLNADQVDGADLDTDGTLATNSDGKIPSQKATKTYVDAHISDSAAAHSASAISFSPAGNVSATDVQAAIVELDSEKSSIGHTHSAPGDDVVRVSKIYESDFGAAAMSADAAGNLSAVGALQMKQLYSHRFISVPINSVVTYGPLPIGNRFMFALLGNGGERCFAHDAYNSVTIDINSGHFAVYGGGGTLSGSTGTSGKINLQDQNGTLRIENRLTNNMNIAITVFGSD